MMSDKHGIRRCPIPVCQMDRNSGDFGARPDREWVQELAVVLSGGSVGVEKRAEFVWVRRRRRRRMKQSRRDEEREGSSADCTCKRQGRLFRTTVHFFHPVV